MFLKAGSIGKEAEWAYDRTRVESITKSYNVICKVNRCQKKLIFIILKVFLKFW